jgi:hypothetical protein
MRQRLFVGFAAGLLALALASATLLAVRQPLSLGDYLAIWGLKARAMHVSGELAAVFRVDPAAEFSHPGYPPLWPLLLAGTAKLVGHFDELLLALLRPLLLALAAWLTVARTCAPLPWRLLAAAALVLLPYFQAAAYAGYAEGLLLVLVLAALLLLERPVPNAFMPVAAGILLALAASTKNEGALALVVVTGLLLASRRLRDAAIVGVLGVGLGILPWSLFRASHGVKGLAVYSFDAFHPAKLLAALSTLGEVAGLRALPWLLGAVLLLALAPAVRRKRRPLLLGAAAYSGLILGSYAFAHIDVAWLVTWSWDRLALLPVAALLPALMEAAAEPFGDREP